MVQNDPRIQTTVGRQNVFRNLLYLFISTWGPPELGNYKATSLLMDSEGHFTPLEHNNIDCLQEKTLCSHVIFSGTQHQSILINSPMKSSQDSLKVKSSKAWSRELTCWFWARGTLLCKWYNSFYCIPHYFYFMQQRNTEMENTRIITSKNVTLKKKKSLVLNLPIEMFFKTNISSNHVRSTPYHKAITCI